MTCTISLPSMTLAQKARGVLEANGITVHVARLSPELAKEGCAWGITLDCKALDNTKHVLSVSGIPYKKVWSSP